MSDQTWTAEDQRVWNLLRAHERRPGDPEPEEPASEAAMSAEEVRAALADPSRVHREGGRTYVMRADELGWEEVRS
jgi:hypothetical protein